MSTKIIFMCTNSFYARFYHFHAFKVVFIFLVYTINKETKKLTQKSKTIYSNITASSTYVSGSYVWHWYGFDFVMDANNAGIFSAKLGQYAALLAGGAAIGFMIPGVSFVCGASSATIYYWSSVASEGSYGSGCIAYYLGSPSSAQLDHVGLR